ncbi:hypothetical protein PR048_012568 [Dryococelus australis]|uniref:Uncharacterized protein n=1 Tax=Dryococelus australis TaxID=614101 RepID=A0ABQ9HQ55_9NEOP|nr:hypothetical protein PR048_012568 [Dryococelus australis]
MHTFGITCSFDEVLRFKKSAATAVVEDAKNSGILDAAHGMVQVEAFKRISKSDMAKTINYNVSIRRFNGPKKPNMPQKEAQTTVLLFKLLSHKTMAGRRAGERDLEFMKENVRALRLLAEEVLRQKLKENEVASKHQLFNVLDGLASKSRACKLWIYILIKPVIIMMKFVRPESEGEWMLHLEALREMVPYFISAGHLENALFDISEGTNDVIHKTHIEEGKSRVLSDKTDREGIRQKLDLCIDPLNATQLADGLLNAVSGKVSRTEVSLDNSLEIGLTQMEEFEKC